MVILKSLLLNQFPEIIFGFSTKIWNNDQPPFYFNLSLSVGDNEEKVKRNRENFFNMLGLGLERIVFQKQIHSDIIKYVDSPGYSGEGDSLITDKSNIGLTISVADCIPVFIYDRINKVIAAIHSGWRGTQKQILSKTLEKMKNDFNSKSENLYIYLGPSISQHNYEVSEEVACLFDSRYLIPQKDKFLLDIRKINYDMLIRYCISPAQIQISNLCTFEAKNLLHSFRRDGALSGRSFGVIALKGDV
jgi:YfiH family protein